MQTPSEDRTTGFEPLVRAMRRHLITALVVGLVVFGAVVAVTAAMPSNPKATATVQVFPVAGGTTANATNITPVNVGTESRTASSRVVLESASRALGGTPSADRLGSAIKVDGPDGSQNLLIQATAPDGAKAAAWANAVAQAYLDNRGAQARAVVETADSRMAELAKTWSKDPRLAPSIPQLELNRAALQEVNTVPGQLVDQAEASSATAPPRSLLGVVAGLLLGVIVGAGAALLRDKTARKVIDADRLAALTGHEVFDWDGDAEGARRVLDRAEEVASSGPQRSRARTPLLVSGAAGARENMTDALLAAAQERGRPSQRLDIGDSQALDSGREESALVRAAARGPVIALVDPALGFSRLTRLARVGLPLLVADRDTDARTLTSAVNELNRQGDLVLVFARTPRQLPGLIKSRAARPKDKAEPIKDQLEQLKDQLEQLKGQVQQPTRLGEQPGAAAGSGAASTPTPAQQDAAGVPANEAKGTVALEEAK